MLAPPECVKCQIYKDKCQFNLTIDMLVDPARLCSIKLKEVAC